MTYIYSNSRILSNEEVTLKMFLILLVLIILGLIWYIKSSQHPKNFPPGPRFPLPLVGDAYQFGNDISGGLAKTMKKYGKISGMWIGNQRAVAIADFEILHDLMNKNETANRQKMNGAGEYLKIS